MQTQRDHVHAHQFMMGRMGSSLVLGDPSAVENPFNRVIAGLLVGVVLGVLALVGFGIFGWLVPGGSKAWQQAGALIVEKETGTTYIYRNGALHPAMNIASARLILGPQARIQLTARGSLKGVPHGAPVGIPGAPQVLPQRATIARGPWLACPDRAGDRIGLNLDPRAPAQQLADDRFAVVSSRDRLYLLWRGKRHLVKDRSVPAALGVANVEPVKAPPVWIGLLPAGETLQAPRVPGEGEQGPAVAGRRHPVGTQFLQRVDGGQEQMFVLRRDGLAPMNRTQFIFLQARRGGTPLLLDAAAVTAARRSTDTSLTDKVPQLATARWEDPGGRILCQQHKRSGPETISATVVHTALQDAPLHADGRARVYVPPGSGMVVFPVPLPQLRRIPEPYLISDEGVRYHMPDGKALTALGLERDLVPFPKDLLATVRRGPDLDPSQIIVAGEGQ